MNQTCVKQPPILKLCYLHPTDQLERVWFTMGHDLFTNTDLHTSQPIFPKKTPKWRKIWNVPTFTRPWKHPNATGYCDANASEHSIRVIKLIFSYQNATHADLIYNTEAAKREPMILRNHRKKVPKTLRILKITIFFLWKVDAFFPVKLFFGR